MLVIARTATSEETAADNGSRLNGGAFLISVPRDLMPEVDVSTPLVWVTPLETLGFEVAPVEPGPEATRTFEPALPR